MTQYLRPASDISAGSWTDEGSSFNDGSLYTSVQEVAQDGDTSYIDCPNGGGTAEVKLNSVTDPEGNTLHIIHIYAEAAGSGGPERVDAYLYEGSNLRATIIENWAPGRSGYVDINYTLTTIEADSLTAYDDLRIRLVEANIGSGEHIKVTQIYMEVPDAPPAAADDQTPAYLKGSDSAVDNQIAFLQGSLDVLDSLDSYLKGSINVTDAQVAFLQGSQIASDNQSAYVEGVGGVSEDPAIFAARFRIPKRSVDSQGAFTQGVLPASDSQSAFLDAVAVITDSSFAFVQGWSTASDSQGAFVQGQSSTVWSVDAYLEGQDTAIDNLSAYLIGSADSAFSAFAYTQGSLGQTDSQNAYLAGQDTSLDSQSAFLAGSLDASDSQGAYLGGVISASDSQIAYTEGAGGADISDSSSAFTEGQVGTVYIAMKTVNCSTSTGTQDITTTDLASSVPKAAILITWRADEDGVQEDKLSRLIGITDGTDNHGSGFAYDGSLGGSIHSFSRIAGVMDWVGWDGYAEFDSFITNGIRIDWKSALSDDWMLTVIFFSGDDLSADVHRMDATSGNSSYQENLGFIPSLLFGLYDIGGGEGGGGRMEQGIGLAANTPWINGKPPQVQVSHWWGPYLGIESGDLFVYDTRFLTNADRIVPHHMEIDGFTADGYKWSLIGSTWDDAWVLAVDLAGKEIYLGIQDTPTSTGSWVVEDPRFTAEFVMMLMNFADTKNSPIESTPSVPDGDVGALGLSIFNATEERTSAIEYEMGVASGPNDRQQVNSEIVDMDQDDGTTGFDATLTSLDADGFTANFSNTLGVARKWPILVIGTDEWTKSTAGAYLEGLGTAVTSSKSAYLTGPIPVSDSQSAFLEGVPFVASTPAYTTGVATVIDSQSAFLSGPIDLADSTPSYLEGAMIYYVNDSISAYMMSGLAEDSTPAYIEGATIWPFTDDFTGTDVDPWNIAKWVAEEY